MDTIIIAIIGSGALTAVITNLFSIYKDGNRQHKVNQVLLLGEMERRLENYRANGCISAEQLQVFLGIGELYHAEGGNGYADAMLSEVGGLPRA